METTTVKTIKLTLTKTFTKTASIEIEYPSHLPLEEVNDWLYENSHWEERLDDEVMMADLDYDPDFDRTRYDVYQKTISENKVFGGTI